MGFIDLTAINTYKKKKEKKHVSISTHKITVVKTNMAEKIHSTVFTFFVSKSVHLFQTLEGNTERVT